MATYCFFLDYPVDQKAFKLYELATHESLLVEMLFFMIIFFILNLLLPLHPTMLKQYSLIVWTTLPL
jgi:hypothetical protein